MKEVEEGNREDSSIMPLEKEPKAAEAGDLAPISEDVDSIGEEKHPGDGSYDARIQEMELLALNCSIDPAGWLERQKTENEVTGIIFFYGDWCKSGPGCRVYLTRFNELQGASMSQAGCSLYAVSSQKQEVANKLFKEWHLDKFKAVVGDPNNALAHYLKKNPEYFPELRIVDTQKGTAHPFLNRKRYPMGAVGPAVFFMVNDKPVLGWSSRPKLANGAGSMNRPDPDAMWTQVSIMAQCVKEGKNMAMDDGSRLPMAAGCFEITKSLCSTL